MGQKNDVFVSYSRQDANTVDEICAVLEDEGISYWRDCEEITAIEYQFPHRVLEGLRQAKLFLLVLSQNYLRSFYCLTEVLNSLIDVPLAHPAIRVVVLDPELTSHPLIEISKNIAFDYSIFGKKNNGELKQWLLYTPHIDFSPHHESLEKKGSLLMAELTSTHSPSVMKFIEDILKPLLNIELVGHMIFQDRLKDAITLAEETYSALKLANHLPDFLLEAASSRLAHAYSKYGLQEKAVLIRREWFEKAVKYYGRSNGETIHSCDSLVISLSRLGQFDEALSLAQANLGVVKKAYPPSHPLILLSANTLAGLYLDQGNYARAKSILEPTYNNLGASDLGSYSEGHLIIQVNYGFACCRTGDFIKAHNILQNCIEKYEKLKGEDSMDAAQARSKLAENYCRQGQFQEATRQVATAMRVLENLHPQNPVRIMAGVTAIQCFYYSDQFDEWHAMFDKFISPGLLESSENGIGRKLRLFLLNSFELIPPQRIANVLKSF